MKQFKKIICPYDFSDGANEAIKFAVKIADEKTIITLFCVVELPYRLDSNGYTFPGLDEKKMKKDSKENLQNKLLQLRKSYEKNLFDSSLIFDYDPASIILKSMKKSKFDLIVMGSHGRKGLTRILMGSVAESIMRESEVPVLIVKNNAKEKIKSLS